MTRFCDARQRFVLTLGTLLFCVCLGQIVSCKFPHKLGPSDVSDTPQSDSRDKLRGALSDLTYQPPAPAGERLLELVRASIYTESRDIAALFLPVHCSSVADTCAKTLLLYRWDAANRRFEPRESIVSRSILSLANYDLTHDRRDDLILSTQQFPSRKRGLEILGVTQATHLLVPRFQSDTIVPAITALGQNTYGLIEYDSIYAKLVTGIAVKVPKRFYHASGEFFLEAPDDSSWYQVLQHVRDSTGQIYLLTRDEMRRQPHPDAALQGAFVRAAITEALLDSSWSNAQSFVLRALTDLTTKLSSPNYNTLLRLALLNRAAPFVRQSQRWSPAVLMTLSDLDDALALGDTARARAVIVQLPRLNASSDVLYRASAALVSHNVLLREASWLLGTALAAAPRAVYVIRLRAHVFDLLGSTDSSRALLARSLQFDSTSAEALRIRQELAIP